MNILQWHAVYYTMKLTRGETVVGSVDGSVEDSTGIVWESVNITSSAIDANIIISFETILPFCKVLKCGSRYLVFIGQLLPVFVTSF